MSLATCNRCEWASDERWPDSRGPIVALFEHATEAHGVPLVRSRSGAPFQRRAPLQCSATAWSTGRQCRQEAAPGLRTCLQHMEAVR